MNMTYPSIVLGSSLPFHNNILSTFYVSDTIVFIILFRLVLNIFVRFTSKYFHILMRLQRVLLIASIKGFFNL